MIKKNVNFISKFINKCYKTFASNFIAAFYDMVISKIKILKCGWLAGIQCGNKGIKNCRTWGKWWWIWISIVKCQKEKLRGGRNCKEKGEKEVEKDNIHMNDPRVAEMHSDVWKEGMDKQMTTVPIKQWRITISRLFLYGWFLIYVIFVYLAFSQFSIQHIENTKQLSKKFS